MTKRLELFALIAISALAASFLFLNPGFLNTRGGGDSPFLLFRLHQLYSALTQGVFPVRWMPDAAYGLGYPFFSYYAALPLYLAALFKLLGASYVLALKLTQLTGFLLAAVAMYGWLRSIGASRLAAWVAAATYTFAPFHLVNVYVRGDSLNEFFAFALYPLCLWSVQRLNNQLPITNNPLSVIGYRLLPLALSYAALTLTHNISALIFSPFLGLYIVFLLFAPQQNKQQHDESRLSFDAPRKASFIVHCSLSLALGLALSAFFWVPALREADFGQLAPVTSGYFHYSNHFRGLNLIQPALLFNYGIAASDSSPFAMGLAQAIATAIALLAALARMASHIRNTRYAIRTTSIFHFSFFICSLVISTFMITPLSQSLWDRLPLLPFVQFPWRFLSVQSLFASALLAFAFTPSAESETTVDPKPLSRLSFDVLLAALLSALCILPALLSLRPDFIPLADSDITPERLQTYEYFTGNIGTTINYEYLPKWTQPRPYSSEEFIFGGVSLKVLSGDATGERAAKRAASQTWRITVESDLASLAVPLLYWPGWEARANGQLVELRPADGLGWVAFDLPKGEHILELRLGDTDTRRNATLGSIIALIVAVVLAQPGQLRQRIISAPRLILVSAMALIPVIILAVAGHVINPRQQSVGAATMDFDQQGYLHSSAVTFGNGDVLLGYNYSAEALAPGDHLGLALQWRADHNATFNIDLVSPAEHLLKLPHTFAAVSGIAEDQIAVTLQIPPNLSTGVYLLRLSLIQDGNLLAPAFTSTNQPRGALYLRPIRIIRADDSTTRPHDIATTLTPAIGFAHLTATQTDPASLTLNLDWHATAPVPANYMLALRLHDTSNFELAALDVQPTGGIYPTSAWRVGEIIPDVYQFELPSGLPPGDYPLTITLYDPVTLRAAATLTTPVQLSQWSPPPGTDPLHRFTDTLALHDVTL
ncbi:MAG TPA: hypothetical protein VJ020_13420, partial [Anaerolineales bacterium]|nr:hypothetical protein [Anaerolineales bacterium]